MQRLRDRNLIVDLQILDNEASKQYKQTITSDWGSFAENNLHGVTGYRCRTMGDYVDAINNIDRIKPLDCRTFGENFTLEKVAPRYEKYFQDVLDVYNGAGWYAEGNGIDAMTMTYPSND